MNKLTAYAIYTDYDFAISGHPFDHVFVVSDANHDWRCYGRGRETIGAGAREIATGLGEAEWIDMVVGRDPDHPTGLEQRVDGVCQSVANRIMAFSGCDVSNAHGYDLTLLLYGKFGFFLDEFIQKVKASAATLNQAKSDSISQARIDEVVRQLSHSMDDELDLLMHDFDARPGPHGAKLSEQQRADLRGLYSAYHQERIASFAATELDRASARSRERYMQKLAPSALRMLKSAERIVGEDLGTILLGSPAEEALRKILG